MADHEAIRKALVDYVRQMPGNMTDPTQRIIKAFKSQEAYRQATNPDAIAALLADRDRLAAEVESLREIAAQGLWDDPEAYAYDTHEAIRVAELWRAGKLIGGSVVGVRNGLLAEVERLTKKEKS